MTAVIALPPVILLISAGVPIPDYRAQQALEVIANAGFVGINHEGRAYLAIASYHRYQGLSSKVGSPLVAELASRETIRKAQCLAALFRVLYLFSASTPGVLPTPCA